MEITRRVGWLIMPTFVDIRWWQWPSATLHLLRMIIAQIVQYPSALSALCSHPPCSAAECYRLVVGWNGREYFRWRMHG